MISKKPNSKPSQVDFTNVRYAPVVNSVVVNKGMILLLKRSRKLNFYPGYWNGVSGFLDDKKSIKQKILIELSEELGLTWSDISKILIGQPFLQEAPEYKKTWLVVPAMAEVKKTRFRLDWETDQAKWFKLNEIKKLNLVPGFDKVLSNFF